MNCRPGDLAVVVKSRAGNEGRIVTCLRFLGAAPGMRFEDYWLIDSSINARGVFDSVPLPYARDAWLRPIRDSDGEDEMLRIAGKPEALPAPCSLSPAGVEAE